LKKFIIAYANGIDDLANMTIKQMMTVLDLKYEADIENLYCDSVKKLCKKADNDGKMMSKKR
jgi:hypothetical protein